VLPKLFVRHYIFLYHYLKKKKKHVSLFIVVFGIVSPDSCSYENLKNESEEGNMLIFGLVDKIFLLIHEAAPLTLFFPFYTESEYVNAPTRKTFVPK